MPQTPHTERHFLGSAAIRDVVIGMSDGLTVPFALAAGLSGATTASHLIVTAGLAEIAAGAISMGLGGYLAGKSDIDHYNAEKAREHREVIEMPAEEVAEIGAVFARYGLTPEQIEPVVTALKERPEAWVDFMMRFELGLEEPDPKRARNSAFTIGAAYAAGGMVPLAPYLLVAGARPALTWSIAITLVALFGFGVIKGRFTGASPLASGLKTLLIGGLAAGAAFALARLIA